MKDRLVGCTCVNQARCMQHGMFGWIYGCTTCTHLHGGRILPLARPTGNELRFRFSRARLWPREKRTKRAPCCPAPPLLCLPSPLRNRRFEGHPLTADGQPRCPLASPSPFPIKVFFFEANQRGGQQESSIKLTVFPMSFAPSRHAVVRTPCVGSQPLTSVSRLLLGSSVWC
jgi:hypothetical protein